MDTDLKNPNNCNNKTLTDTLDSQKVEEEVVDESSSLLSPRKGGMSKKRSKKSRRKVQWNDKNGNKLAEILEFQPRLVSRASLA
ncbi:hypothetical protein BVC80_9099g137 [Macleaya cordata]|uniref:Uncharacterized protein n=1 Tax=Macleaya cordata TaxID=56857 RepID=A0A200PVT6_MACCD|nr:hypothetical protein BVC80_9099g137 [Macleaya cordata]